MITANYEEVVKPLLKQLEENQLGCFLFLFGKENGSSVTVLPEWSILSHQEGKIELKINEKDISVGEWFERAEQTLTFLFALEQTCKEAESVFGTVFKILKETVESFVETAASEKPNQKTLH